MFLLGTLVNTVSILLGTTIGSLFSSIPERLKTTVMQGVGLFVVALGLSMALSGISDTLYIVFAVVIGSILGAWWNIEDGLQRFGKYVESKIGKTNGQMAEAFVFASLVYCVGSMAVVGAIQSGMNGQNTILYTKSVLDGFSAIVFTSTMGIGVGLAAIPVFLYEGLIALLAYLFGSALHSEILITDMTSVGGILIMAIGINVLEIKKLQVGNMLPAMLVVVVLRWLGLHGSGIWHAIAH
ncbi:MAG: DUF554 domain-containing protein [Firmicutes bacterium]|nr:DUF554 domain-containing protein [Bacillota bacterium]